MSYLKKIVYLTEQQYAALAAGTLAGHTEGVQDDILYITTDEQTINDMSGVLSVPKGGTGKSSFGSGKLLVGNGSNALDEITATDASDGGTIVKRDSSGNFSAGTITATLSGSATHITAPATSGYTSDDYGNFKHKRTTTSDCWNIYSNAGTAKFSVYWETGNVTAVGAITAASFSGSGASLNSLNASNISSGTLNLARLGNQNANVVLAGPSSGNAAAPTFRALVAADIPNLSWSKITSDKPTTLSGYGITDAKIASGVITLGSNTITPVTSVNGHTGNSVSVTAADLGLSKAMRFIGVATAAITDGGTEDPTISGYSTKTAGDVVIDSASSREYVWSTTGKWELLGGDSSYKTTQTAVTDPTASTTTSTTFIDTISQDANGVIAATKKTLPTASSTVAGITKVGASGGAAAYNHTHTLSIAEDTGTNALTLAYGKKYKLTAGGSTYIFTMPASDNVNTATAADNILDGSNSGTEITYAPYTAQQSKLSFDTSTTAPTRTDRLNLNGFLYATKYNVAGQVTLQWNATDSSLDFVFA